MTPKEFHDIRWRTNSSIKFLCELLGYSDERYIRRFELGERPIPRTAAIVMEMMDRRELPARYYPGYVAPETTQE